jgi:hypothetical protein
MISSSLRRRAAVLLVVAFLVLPWASAAAPRGKAAQLGPGTVWDLVNRLWGILTAVWSETGCSIDPNGLGCPGDTSSQETPDTGCSIDPDGRCLPGS